MRENCPLCRAAVAAERDEGRLHVATFDETVALLGENQGCRGWTVLILREHIEHMAELTVERQARVFSEVARMAAAIRGVIGPVRINYECLGNVEPHIHWHIIPRHADDPTPRAPVWGWPSAQLRGSMDEAAREKLAFELRAAVI